jgi:hypothetical protein
MTNSIRGIATGPRARLIHWTTPSNSLEKSLRRPSNIPTATKNRDGMGDVALVYDSTGSRVWDGVKWASGEYQQSGR